MPYKDKDKQRQAVRDAMRRKRGTVRRPGRPKKGDGWGRPAAEPNERAARRQGAPDPAPDAQAVLPTTPEAAQEWLARVMAGRVEADAVQVAAARAMLDSRRRDGGAAEAKDLPWLAEDAALARRMAEAHYEERYGGGTGAE